MDEATDSVNPLYGLGNYVNKNKLKEGNKIDVQYQDGKYLLNGQPINKSTNPSIAMGRASIHEQKSSKRTSVASERQASEATSYKSRSRRSDSGSSVSGSEHGSQSTRSSKSSVKPTKKEDSLNTRHRKVCDRLAHFEFLGVTVDPDLYHIGNIRKAETFITQEIAKDKLKTKLQTISGILWGTSFVLEKTCVLAKLDSMSGWADAVNKDEKEYLGAAKEVYDKYFEDSDSPELKFAMIYAMGILRHTSANKALELLRRLESVTNRQTTNNQAHMRGFTDDEILHT